VSSVPLGIPISRNQAGRPAAEPVFAYVGRFSREKGVAVLLAAFAAVVKELPEATLRLIGDGPLASQLRALTRVLGIDGSVEFRGWASPESMQEHLDDVWCVVCPSLWAEPFGLAAIESIFLGIPVVASDAGGFRETVNDGNGILFKTGDVASLAAAMLSVARGERFSGARLDQGVVEKSRGNHGISEHTRRVRSILTEMTQEPAS
jgi:glycosyltransferase involved in cell wall biosynthesis